MKHIGTLNVTTPTEREIAMTREFDATRKQVFDALTNPERIKRWLLGPPGWSMPVCNVDAKVGGAYRYVWKRDADGSEMGMGGVFREVVSPERIVATELFDQAWDPGEALVTNALAEKNGVTTLTLTILYESRAARDTALKVNMSEGVTASHDRLAKLLAASKSNAATPQVKKS